MPSLRRASMLALAAAALVLPGCGGKMSASDVEHVQRKLSPAAFADIHCGADESSGWDYVCTYTGPKGVREKLGVAVRGHRLAGGTGSVPVSGVLSDGPHMKAPSDSAYARRANEVCARRAAAVRALPPPSNRNDLLDIAGRVVSLEEREQSTLAGIKPPDDERAEAEAFVRSIDPVQRAIETFRDALWRRSAADVNSAQARLASARRASNTAARRLGLSCRH